MWSHEKPILKLEVYEGANLVSLDTEIEPILVLSSGDQEVKSKLGVRDGENFVWNEKLSLSLDPLSDIEIKLCSITDQKLVPLKKLNVNFDSLAETSKPINKWLDFSVEKDTSLSFNVTSILATGLLRTAGTSPQVRVSFVFDHNNYLKIVSAEVHSHKIILKNKEVYTQYYTNIVRNDNKSWIKTFRYSEIYNLKSDLQKVEHGLSKVEFPGKTYFEFLACVWPSLGRFHLRNIEKRQKAIQAFLDFVIQKQRNLESDLLNTIFN